MKKFLIFTLVFSLVVSNNLVCQVQGSEQTKLSDDAIEGISSAAAVIGLAVIIGTIIGLVKYSKNKKVKENGKSALEKVGVHTENDQGNLYIISQNGEVIDAVAFLNAITESAAEQAASDSPLAKLLKDLTPGNLDKLVKALVPEGAALLSKDDFNKVLNELGIQESFITQMMESLVPNINTTLESPRFEQLDKDQIVDRLSDVGIDAFKKVGVEINTENLKSAMMHDAIQKIIKKTALDIETRRSTSQTLQAAEISSPYESPLKEIESQHFDNLLTQLHVALDFLSNHEQLLKEAKEKGMEKLVGSEDGKPVFEAKDGTRYQAEKEGEGFKFEPNVRAF